VVPLTTTWRDHPLHVEVDVPELGALSYAQTELIGVVSRRRLIHHLTDLDEVTMGEVSALITTLLDL
jgi:mRNA-degrading endonuclease toxin of MazEF toxin-antitoxin module